MPNSAPTPLGDLEDWEQRRIQQVVRAYLSPRPPIPGLDEDDLCQEASIAWLQARHTYREDGGASVSTYIGRVVENRLRDLARRAKAGSRWSPRGTTSLDASIDDGDNSLLELLASEKPGPEDALEQSELRARLARVRAGMTGRQQQVMDGLMEPGSRAGLARELKISRDTLYEDIRRIREACRDAGLEVFLD